MPGAGDGQVGVKAGEDQVQCGLAELLAEALPLMRETQPRAGGQTPVLRKVFCVVSARLRQ